MKRACFTLFLLASLMEAGAQDSFRAGVHAGIPTAEAAAWSGLMMGADLYYLFGREPTRLHVGPALGFRNYFNGVGNDPLPVPPRGEDIRFLALGAAARVSLVGHLTGGLDAGYAPGLTDGFDGGFYFRPVIGMGVLDWLEVNASYESLFGEGYWGNFNLGLAVTF